MTRPTSWRTDEDDRRDRIEEREGKWYVVSETGDPLGGPYDSEEEAAERLRQVEAAKAAKDRGDGVQRRRVQRWDVLELRLDASKVVEHPNGWIDVPGVATRVGVFEYADGNGTIRRELRAPDHVFEAASVRSLRGVPFTNDHPMAPLDSTNTRQYQVGTVLDAKPRDDVLEVGLRVTDAGTVQAIRGGKVELSGGYTTELDESPGEHDGIPYDAIQTEIRYNHLALVDKGRAGPVARLHLDSAAAVQHRRDPNMLKITIAGKTYEIRTDAVGKLPPELLVAWGQRQSPERNDQIETAEIMIDGTKLVLPKSVVANIEAQLTGQPAAETSGSEPPEEPAADTGDAEPPKDPIRSVPRGDAIDLDQLATIVADKLRADAVSSVTRAVRDRGDLERRAALVLDSGYRYDEADDLKIMRDAILKIDEDAKTAIDAHKGDAPYLRGMFDRCLLEVERRSDSSTSITTAITRGRESGPVSKMDAARERYLDRIHGRKPDDKDGKAA